MATINWLQYLTYLPTVVIAVEEGHTSFRVGKYEVSVAQIPGNPVHFTLGAALIALDMVLGGVTGTVQCGSIQVSIGLWEQVPLQPGQAPVTPLLSGSPAEVKPAGVQDETTQSSGAPENSTVVEPEKVAPTELDADGNPVPPPVE